MIKKLNEDDWTFDFKKNDENHIIHFFFMKKSFETLIKTNNEVILMNCTYKINRFKMSLFIIFDHIVLHIIFYIIFAFLIKKITFDYAWILNQLKIIYTRLKVLDLTVIITNMKKALMLAISVIHSNINYLLCFWHINNNVLINCKRVFDDKKTWDRFCDKWKAMTYASTEIEFWKL